MVIESSFQGNHRKQNFCTQQFEIIFNRGDNNANKVIPENLVFVR